MTSATNNYTARLLHDLEEVARTPLEGCTALPMEDDLSLWHGNVLWPAGGCSVALHFALSFPQSYPRRPPHIYLYTALPHTNVIRCPPAPSVPPGASHRMAIWDCVPGEDAWFAGYTVATILMEIQATVLDEELQWDMTQASLQAVAQRARDVVVEQCGHRPGAPYPPVPTAEQAARAAARPRKRVLARPDLQRPHKPAASAGSGLQQTPRAPAWSAAGNAGLAVYRHAAGAKVEEEPDSLEDGWQTVRSKKDKHWHLHQHTPSGSTHAAPAPHAIAHTHNSFSLLHGHENSTQQLTDTFQAARRLQKSVAAPKPARPVVKPISELIREILSAEGQADACPEHKPREPAAAFPAPAGSLGPLFDTLSSDSILSILSLLSSHDVASLSATCRGFRSVVEGGVTWQELLRRDYPASQLTASSAAGFRHAYLMQATHTVEELCCFLTKASFDEQALGLLMLTTTNPRTRTVDYACVDMSTISIAAANQGGLRLPEDGTEVQSPHHVLPLYISRQHWERVLAGQSLPQALSVLCPEHRASGRGPPLPGIWLHAMPKLLNTAVVLLMDKGMAASERAMATYCSLHRLFLALADTFRLHTCAAAQLACFMRDPQQRAKDRTPNLGWLLPLFTLTAGNPQLSWAGMSMAILDEAFDRKILWICKHKPHLQASLKAPASAPADAALLQDSFEACQVSARLIAFHVAFLRHIACPEGMTLAEVAYHHDILYGRPGPGMLKRMLAVIGDILAMDSWQAFWRMVGEPPGNPASSMTRYLRLCWKRSLAKGYHQEGMDFSRIQASGVSKILLKGENYTAPSHMQRIELIDRWHWTGEHIVFLDASCLLYGSSGRFIEAIDWRHTHSAGTMAQAAVRHSGDILDHSQRMGTHTISVILADLGAHVMELVIVMSAYSTSHLQDCRSPFVSIKDPATGTSLCEYHLESRPRSELQGKKAVVMCRIYRASRTGCWSVQAVGQVLSTGCTSTYCPILAWISQQGWH